MASKTQVTENRRRRKRAGKGVVRKRKIRREGSTPSVAKLFGDAK